MAYPPARAWRGGRPGDLPHEQADGPLLGRPGPNVGYALALVDRAKARFSLGAHEHVDDAAAVVAEIAMRRAAAFGRAPVVRDVELAVALLGYDGSADEGFVATRTRLVHDAAHAYTTRRSLVDAVPDDLLRASPSQARGPAAAWRAGMAPPPAAP
jgi:hypothetical protein